MRTKLTSSTRYELPKGKREVIYWDAGTGALTGFGVRVILSRDGSTIHRNYLVSYRQHGRSFRRNVGAVGVVPFGAAREKARSLLAAVQLGGNPAEEQTERKKKDRLTFHAVARDFIESKTDLKPSSRRMLMSYLQSPLYTKPFHAVPIDQVSRKDVSARLLAVQRENGQATALALRVALSSLFAFAVRCGNVEANVVSGAYKPERQKSRDRVLSDDELALVWNTVDPDSDYGKVVRLLILTGARRAEVGDMAWPEFDFAKGTWTLPASRSKTGKPLTLPITPAMRSILDTIPKREGTDHLFNSGGFKRWSIGKAALDAQLDLPAWRVHDIRRTFSTRCNDIGIAPHIVEVILNHSLGGVHGVYNKSLYEAEVKAAMEKWSDHIKAITKRKTKAVEKPPVLVAFKDTDAGILPYDKALVEGRRIAREEGCKVTLRDAVSDKIVTTI